MVSPTMQWAVPTSDESVRATVAVTEDTLSILETDHIDLYEIDISLFGN